MQKKQLYVWGRPAKRAIYIIYLIGLARDSVRCVTIDNKVILAQIHPAYSLALCPLQGKSQPSYKEVLFYADCLSYEHDLPALVPPLRSEFYRHSYKFSLSPASKKCTAESYFEDLACALELIRDIRVGGFRSSVEFRWNGWEEAINLPYTQKYSTVSQSLHLYGAALRQLDPLSEYLGYYRVLESILHNNAKKWITNNLDRIQRFDFGTLTTTLHHYLPNQKPINVFAVYRRRALARLRVLKRTIGTQAIADYLWNENRCGIAHGTTIKRSDFGSDYFSVAKDCYLLKLLARIAIEDSVK